MLQRAGGGQKGAAREAHYLLLTPVNDHGIAPATRRSERARLLATRRPHAEPANHRRSVPRQPHPPSPQTSRPRLVSHRPCHHDPDTQGTPSTPPSLAATAATDHPRARSTPTSVSPRRCSPFCTWPCFPVRLTRAPSLSMRYWHVMPATGYRGEPPPITARI